MPSIEKLFKAYFVRLSAFAYAKVDSEEVAKDIVHDAFLALLENDAILQKDDLLIKGFLYSTVKNMALNHYRHQQMSARVHASFRTSEWDDIDILDTLIKSEIIGELHHELAQLPDGCQHICRLIYLEEKKYEEVAQELNVSINTVKSQRQRALRILKDKFLGFIYLFF